LPPPTTLCVAVAWLACPPAMVAYTAVAWLLFPPPTAPCVSWEAAHATQVSQATPAPIASVAAEYE
jgi:hypothetical protein